MIDQTTVLILCGGLATRLQPITKTIPKSLVMVNNKPMLQYQLDMLQKQGIRHVVLCVGYLGEMIKDTFGDKYKDILLEYSFDGSKQLGTGGAIKKTYSKLSNTFFVLYGDSYLPINYLTVEKEFLNSANPALMTVYENKNQFDSSNVEFVDGNLINYQKGSSDKKMQHIDYGLTYFRSNAFLPCLDQSVFDLSEVCHDLTTHGLMGGFEVFERFYEIGSVHGIHELSEYLRKVSQ